MIQQNAENINDSEKHTNSAEDLITNLYGGNVCRVKETCSACSKYAVVVLSSSYSDLFQTYMSGSSRVP